MIGRARGAFLVVLLLLVGTAAGARPPVAPPSAAELIDTVRVLTDPGMEGRRSGTSGGDHAARQIADWLAAAGLRPGGDQSTFFQSFPIPSGTVVASNSAFEMVTPLPQTYNAGRDWMPHAGSRRATVTAEIVFVGHGTTGTETGRDEYAGVDVRDRIALALDGGPIDVPARGPADAGRRRPSRLDKVIAARGHGAAALLVIADALPPLSATPAAVDLVSATITRATADRLLAPTGKTSAELGGAAAFATGVTVRLAVDLTREQRQGMNVVGVLPGSDPTLAREAVVVGAHYDHLGSDGGRVYHGADDNASGTAVVLGLARAVAAAGPAPRSLVFALFGAEEIGLVGSAHYVKEPRAGVDRTVAMLNFDMVGRLRDGRLHVGGVDSGSGLGEALRAAATGEPVTLEVRGAPFGPSDHSSFYGAGVPILFFHTGGHDDYHKPTDTADKLNADGLALVARIGAGIVERLASGPPPAYAKLTRPPRAPRRSTPEAFLGVSTDPLAAADGLWLAGVVAGSAAERGGVRQGDVIIRLAGVSVDSFDELRAVLRGKRPGDTVPVVYLRNGMEHATSVTLDARP